MNVTQRSVVGGGTDLSSSSVARMVTGAVMLPEPGHQTASRVQWPNVLISPALSAPGSPAPAHAAPRAPSRGPLGEITEVKHRRWYFAAPGVRARHGGSREQGRERDPTVTMTRCNNPPAP